MKYTIKRTDTADGLIRQIILGIAENFDNETALAKLDEMEEQINALADNPYIGVQPRYIALRRQGYRMLIMEKDLAFYKVDEAKKEVTGYAVVDQRQDYMSILRGL